ncbi:helix-turn-helix domain-containing protein [Methanofollis ethanolicus]|uniref:helix-turn-helix domain-containing protein n=1 Tax=Methanofollis ethanolicus TaxID=488124 RepID=UPI00082BD707|nr:helix-turn-helix domain-containing protein [Methanofollis ethanolicus]
MEIEPYYNAVDAGAILGASPQTVGRWIRSGELRATKIGRRWKIRESDLEAFIEKMGHNTGEGKQAPTCSAPSPGNRHAPMEGTADEY